MEVILREHVDNLGKRGEIVKVADGYARNYLLPRKLALLGHRGNKKQIERERGKFEAREAEERKVAEAVAARVASLEVVIARKVGETDVLFGSVTAPTSPGARRRALRSIAGSCSCPSRSRSSASTSVPLKLHREVTAPVKVKVVAEGARQKSKLRSIRSRKSSMKLECEWPGVLSFCRSFHFWITSDFSSFMPETSHPNGRSRTISKPSAPSSARSCSTTTRSTWRRRSSTRAISSGTLTAASSTRW